MYRQFLLLDGTLQRVLAATQLLSGDPLLLSLVIKLCVNMDVLKERKVRARCTVVLVVVGVRFVRS
jgi:hypothetical protein